MNKIVFASDVSNLQSFIINELSRRSYSYTAKDSLNTEDIAYQTAITHVYDNCKKGGYTGSSPSSTYPLTSEVTPMITFMKTLYNKNLRS
jgi:hypothetical protein